MLWIDGDMYTIAGAVFNSESICVLLNALDKQESSIKSTRTVCGLQ
jgi:hypothetical protein